MIFCRLTVSRLFDEKSCHFLLFKAYALRLAPCLSPGTPQRGLSWFVKVQLRIKKRYPRFSGFALQNGRYPSAFLTLTNRFFSSPKGLPSKKNADASFLKSLPFLNESNRHLYQKALRSDGSYCRTFLGVGLKARFGLFARCLIFSQIYIRRRIWHVAKRCWCF